MNIFRALSDGNGKISETNVTSFMSYLFNSSNELKNSFFILFINLIDENNGTLKICDQLELKKNTIREQISTFSNKYLVTSEPEYLINDDNGKRQIPDILVKVILKESQEDFMYFVIENKINKGALKKGQIEKQLDFFLQSEDINKEKPIYSVLITPDDNVFEKMYIPAEMKHHRTIWLKWTNHVENSNSIEAILRKLIIHEHNAEIEPLDPNTQFIFKSFIDYISTEFSFRESGKRNFSFKGFDEIGMANVELDGSSFCIKRFSNKMIRLFDKNGTLLEGDVKPILRRINDKYELGIDLFHSSGTAKNTQVLGEDIINSLKKEVTVPLT